MFDVINPLFSGSMLSFWFLLLMVMVERYVPWPDKYHPISLVKLLAIGMAAKVLPAQPQSVSQQKISGSLAVMVLLIFVATILAILIYFSEYPMFFDGLMLLLALRFQNIVAQTNKVSAALATEKKLLARQTLSLLVLRQTENMSPMGMVKANVESILLRFGYQYCTVIFWYLLTGGPGALVYRFLYELCLCWNHKLSRFKHFGLPIRGLVSILQWIPTKLAGLSVVLAVNITRGSKALIQKQSYQSNHAFILNTCGASLGIKLGGPAYYDQKKVRTGQYGGTRPIILADNSRVLTAINRARWVWLTVYFVLSATVYLVSSQK
jgi:adenosylcobinamide-phosphate synthase